MSETPRVTRCEANVSLSPWVVSRFAMPARLHASGTTSFTLPCVSRSPVSSQTM